MSFTITFDYRFDSTGFFNSPDHRAALEAAADQWEAVIRDDFENLPVGTVFSIRNPTTFATETITLTHTVDDIIVFVGATNFPGATLAVAGPDGGDAAGDVYTARISPDFRGTGAVTDFEPWAGAITFDSAANWSFSLDNPRSGQNDFMSVAVHEIGHILGVGTSGAFDRWIVGDTFTGPNTTSLNNGQPIPIEDDLSHVEEGFAGDTVALDPLLITGSRVLISSFDKAILADIGYDIVGFIKQGSTPPIATASGERIFGRDVADTIDGLGGDDSLQGADGDDLLVGNTGDDDLFGQNGNDTLLGGPDDDYLDGGDGNDELRGGAGADTYYGQGGLDVFVIGTGDGRNTLSDFDLSNETIRLLNSGFTYADEAIGTITKPFSNVSRLTLGDGTTVDVYHASQSGSPLTAAHIELVNEEDVERTSLDHPPEPEEDPTAPSDEDQPGLEPRTGSVLTGTPFDDANLMATGAFDRINGMEGVDSAFFAGEQSNYTVSFTANGVTVADRSEGGLGPIALDNVELIDFGAGHPLFDGPMDLRQFGGHAGLEQDAFESFVELYIAYFNRAPDAVGLAFWGTVYANGVPLEEIAIQFANQPETLEAYPTGSGNFRFAADVYQNVLGRAPDIDGLRFWAKALDDGTVSRGAFILEFLQGVKAVPTSDAPQSFVDRQAADQRYLEQKTDLGALFAVHRGMSDIDDAALVMALFDGSETSVASAVNAIETLYAAAMDPVNGDFLMPVVGILDDPFAL